MNEDVIKLESPSNTIKEGKAEILEPPGRKVFYNPVQEFNRDLSILSLHVLSEEWLENVEDRNGRSGTKKKFTILEALSATGLRSIRYAKEIPNVTQIIANDISEFATKSIKENVMYNNVENLVHVNHANAVSVMQNHIEPSKRFEAVDLDPYGSPTQFLDSAVQCVADGGILLVTCTDMAILCGNFPETCYTKYGALSLRNQAQHEMAIRIVLQCIQSHASRYKRYIVPMLSVSVDFYIRVFVKIYTSAEKCKNVTSNLSLVYHCTSCDSVTLQPLGVKKKAKDNKNVKYCLPHVPVVDSKCSYCGGNHHVGGPIWNQPIHDENFVTKLLLSEKINELGTSKRLVGMLSMIKEELDVPLYYSSAKLSCFLKVPTIPIMKMRSAILNGNYKVSFSHASRQSIKTNAPMTFIWDIMREWAKENTTTKKPEVPGVVNYLLSQPVKNQIDFSLRPDANPLSREMRLTRYQENPLPFWGPGTRSTMMSLEENPKKNKNQSKKRFKRFKGSQKDANESKEIELQQGE
ncbi:hypothetical protein RUM43_004423 [Polyplax serrata]|uniref:tRNA (guanine(26)-N(2))-dimethyltransferase n=1 Tax=Polyplax serrata TaxID=468196 RepID=A0AAN8SB99_POLSC